MAIKIQNIKGRRIRPKNQYKLRVNFMIGDADHYYDADLTFDPDSKEESYVFEKLARLFKRAAGDWSNRIYSKSEVIAKQISDSLVGDEKFSVWLNKIWETEEAVDEQMINDFFSEYIGWRTCEYNGDYHTITGIDYWYIDKEGDKCKVSFTGSMKL